MATIIGFGLTSVDIGTAHLKKWQKHSFGSTDMKNICQKNLVQVWFAPVLAQSSAVWCYPCDYFKDGKTQIVAAQIVTTQMVTKLKL